MSLATATSRALKGVTTAPVVVETHISSGLPSLAIVGMPETAVRESRDRVRSAIINSHFDFPLGRITVNLAPADLPKSGGRFDLAIALTILAASDQIPGELLNGHELIGELGLDGSLRPVNGVLPSALACRDAQRTLILPADNGTEAALVSDLHCVAAESLLEACAHLSGQQPLPLIPTTGYTSPPRLTDLADVHGQQRGKRALEIAASGGHSLLFIGPPGGGKTMLASRLTGLLPPLTEQQALETAIVHSVSRDGLDPQQWRTRPFQAPHHTASPVALVGGGQPPAPGEISLAHNGVLFLDELPEFSRNVLESLREPLESGQIRISRAGQQADFPARFQLVAAMNPCPCGYVGHSSGKCRCTPDQISRYRNRLSGPLLDRIDMHVELPAVSFNELQPNNETPEEQSAMVAQRVFSVQKHQMQRQERLNGQLSSREIEQYCRTDKAASELLARAMDRLALSARAYHRVLMLARTIADMDEQEAIGSDQISEAIGYRVLDRQNSPV
ncbi:MAG TPA: ATP-dependent protease [Gammaproteobacteria bacterium]|nr:ATP-dependent protease [Gammaproteobacteria bacterium]